MRRSLLLARINIEIASMVSMELLIGNVSVVTAVLAAVNGLSSASLFTCLSFCLSVFSVKLTFYVLTLVAGVGVEGVGGWVCTGLQVNKYCNRSCTWGMIHKKINLICPG